MLVNKVYGVTNGRFRMVKIDLEGKTYLVTGGAGVGVGAGICEAILDCGGRVLINDIDCKKTEIAAGKHSNAFSFPGDISDPEVVKELFAQIKKEHGTIHGLVNNAGVGLRKKANLANESEFDRIYSIDVKAVWMMTKAFANQLVKENEIGHIVNISSVHAHQTISKYAIYASAKAAVEGLTRGISIEMGEHGIRCNAIAPGYVDSISNRESIRSWSDDPETWLANQQNKYQSLHHPINPRDCGNVAVFLLSDLARSITGQTIVVDAGFTNLLHANDFIPDK